MTRRLQSAFSRAIRPFSDLTKAPRAIWYIIGAFVIDSTAYFGILTLMTTYLGHDLGWGDAYAAATVPKITIIMRKAYGGAYLAMCSSDLGADLVFAWPTAEIAVMGAEGAVKILFKREISSATDPKKKEKELSADYRDKFAAPYEAASKALITDVIEPSQTRGIVAMALRNTLAKRETRPPKKHGNIPL